MEPYYPINQNIRNLSEDEEEQEMIKNFLVDNKFVKLFGEDAKYLDLKDVKLSYLTPHQEAIVSELYAVLIHLEAIERKYREKGINLDLSPVKRAIAGDIKGIVATARGRGGFERKLWVTQITREESSDKKRPLLSGFWRRGEEE